MSKKSVKKCQLVKFVVVNEFVCIVKNFGYEEMLSELEVIVVDVEMCLVEDEVIV